MALDNKSLTAKVEGNKAGEGNAVALMKNMNTGLEKMKPRLEAVLPPGFPVERFMTNAYYHYRGTPGLWNCDPRSVLDCYLRAAQEGLDLSIPNEANVIPFGNKAQYIRGYKGDMKNVRRNPNMRFINAETVYSNDNFSVEFGSDPKIHHSAPPFGKPRGDIIGFYAVAKDQFDNSYHTIMSVEDVEAHAKKYDPKAKKGPFGNMGSEGRKHKHFIPYGLKTAIHQLANRKLDLNSDWQLDDSAEREAKKQIKIDDRSFRPEAPAIESEIESELPEPNWDEVGAEVEAKQRGNVNDDS